MITNALYDLGMTGNSFSVTRTLDKGFYSTSDKDQIYNKAYQVCDTTVRNGNLFKMNFKHISELYV